MFATASLDEDENDLFATNARFMCIACAATACVMAMESLIKMATPGEELDMAETPSEAFDRQEVIVRMGESHVGQNQKYQPIIRSDNGKYFGFGESNMPVLDRIEGRFAQTLPPKVATAEHRMLGNPRTLGGNFSPQRVGAVNSYVAG